MKKVLIFLILASTLTAGVHKKDGRSQRRRSVSFSSHKENKGMIEGTASVNTNLELVVIRNHFKMIKGKWTSVQEAEGTDSVLAYFDDKAKLIRVYATDRQLLHAYAAYIKPGEQLAGKSKMLDSYRKDVEEIAQDIQETKSALRMAKSTQEDLNERTRLYLEAGRTPQGRRDRASGKITNPTNLEHVTTREAIEKIKKTLEDLQKQEEEARQKLENAKRS